MLIDGDTQSSYCSQTSSDVDVYLMFFWPQGTRANEVEEGGAGWDEAVRKNVQLDLSLFSFQTRDRKSVV